jgi:hypothetical protein
MNDRQQDADLRARFQAQRERDREEAPSFAEMMARARTQAVHAVVTPVRAPGRTIFRRIAYAGGLVAAAAIGGLLMVNPRSNEDAFEQAVASYQSGPALGAWQSPTDGLLNIPGSQLISSVPSVGTGAQ